MSKLSPPEFVKTYLPYARLCEEVTDISPVFTLAQAALESGWGERAVGNMFFGIKASPSTPANQRQLIRTREVLATPNATFPEVISVKPLVGGKYEYVVKDWFRKYDSPADSFVDHSRFFLENKRYAEALKVAANPYAFAEAITKAGYATDPSYAKTLQAVCKTVEKYL